jgi:hypothetical protein
VDRPARSFLVVAIAAAAVLGCTGDFGATPFASRPDLIRIDDVDVRLVDTVGLTEAVLHVPDSAQGPFQQGIETVPGSPRDLIIPWSGGACDTATTLTLSREGAALVMAIRSIVQVPSGQLCPLGARLNAVVVRFRDVPPPIRLDAP